MFYLAEKIWDRTYSGQAFMTLSQQVILSLKTFIEANLNRLESGQLFIWLYVSLVESPDVSFCYVDCTFR